MPPSILEIRLTEPRSSSTTRICPSPASCASTTTRTASRDTGLVRQPSIPAACCSQIELGSEHGEPSVWLHYDTAAYLRAQQPGSMRFSVMTLVDGDEERLAARLRVIVAG